MLPSISIIVIEALILAYTFGPGLFIVVCHHNIVIVKVYVEPVCDVNPIELKGPR